MHKICSIVLIALIFSIWANLIYAEKTNTDSKVFQLFGKKSSFYLSGYLQINYFYDSSKNINNEFKIRRARLDFRGDIENAFKWRIQADAVQTVKELNTLQDQAIKVVVRPILLDANIDFAFAKYFSIRFGQFKIPFSYENLQSSNELDLINRAQLVEKIVPGRDIGSQGRDIGLVSNAEYKFSDGQKSIKLFLGLFNGNGINVGDDNNHKDFVYRLELVLTKRLFFALSQYFGKKGLNEFDRNAIGVDFYLDLDKISFRGEYAKGKDILTKKDGWYFQAKYKINSLIDLICRYDSYDQNKAYSGDRTNSLIFGVNYYPYKRIKFQLNYERKMLEGDREDNNLILTQFQIIF